MPHRALVGEIAIKVEDAIAREDWRGARSGVRELARILVDAIMVGEAELIAQVDEILGQIYTDLSLDDSFSIELMATALGWGVDGLRDVSQLARRRRPPMTSDQRAATLRDAETRILALLDEGNGGPRSNREIAEKLQLNVSTVARVLAGLRKAKKVKSWPEGKFMMNQLSKESLPIRQINARLFGVLLETDKAQVVKSDLNLDVRKIFVSANKTQHSIMQKIEEISLLAIDGPLFENLEPKEKNSLLAEVRGPGLGDDHGQHGGEGVREGEAKQRSLDQFHDYQDKLKQKNQIAFGL